MEMKCRRHSSQNINIASQLETYFQNSVLPESYHGNIFSVIKFGPFVLDHCREQSRSKRFNMPSSSGQEIWKKRIKIRQKCFYRNVR